MRLEKQKNNYYTNTCYLNLQDSRLRQLTLDQTLLSFLRRRRPDLYDLQSRRFQQRVPVSFRPLSRSNRHHYQVQAGRFPVGALIWDHILVDQNLAVSGA